VLYPAPRYGIKPQPGIGLAKDGIRGLIAFFPFNEGVGLPRMLFSRPSLTGSFTGTPLPTWTPISEMAIQSGTSTSQTSAVDFGSPPEVQDLALLSGGFSWAARIYCIQVVGGIMERNDNNGSAGWAISVDTGGNILWQIVFSGSDFRCFGGPIGNRFNRWATIASSWDGNHTAGSNTLFAIDGESKPIVAISAGSGSQTSDAAQHLYIGKTRFGTGSGALGGLISWVAFWNRQLNQGELCRVTDDQYGMFERQIRPAGISEAGAPVSIQPASWIV
jgi:hypothetical protein